jgi:hypothetical protein
MAKKITTLSLDEEVIIKADELVKIKPEFANRSNLITTLILREHARVKKEKQ